ncbi:MAG: COR domain-containing protein [Bacteroidia bacterium]
MKNLTTLYLSDNSLSELPLQIGELINLTKLSLWGNSLSGLPSQIGQLKKLTTLDLNRNSLSELPFQISQLKKLTTLDLSLNSLSELPSQIGQLKKLATLDLRNNSLSKLPPKIIELTNLTTLSLENNSLRELPPQIIELTYLTELHLHGNPFPNVPDEVFEMEPKDIIQTILEIQKANEAGTSRPLHEAKAIFVGESNYGKTHLIEMLRHGKIQREITTTHGIERNQIALKTQEKNIKLNLWDLGGQSFMHATHQFFFTERTLYVLVTLARKERKELNFWLTLIQKLGNNSPVLIVANQKDKDPHHLPEAELKRDYPNIQGFAYTSIYDEATIDEFQQKIETIILDEQVMPHIYDVFTPQWFMLKTHLESMERDYISYERFEDECQTKVPELAKASYKATLKLLNALGIVVSFVDDTRLSSTQILNPKWVTEGVYAILNDPRIKDQEKGRFKTNELSRILDPERYPTHKHSFLLDLMEKFQLCYPISSKVYLIPDLMEDIEPEMDWDSEGAMHFRYDYDSFNPDSIMTRFIVLMHESIDGDLRWRSGVVLKPSRFRAKVYRGFAEHHINIEIHGPKEQRRGYLESLWQRFAELHKSFKGLKPKQLVPYTHQAQEVWLNYEHLLKYEENERPYFHPELEVDISVSSVLDGYSNRMQRALSAAKGPYKLRFANQSNPDLSELINLIGEGDLEKVFTKIEELTLLHEDILLTKARWKRHLVKKRKGQMTPPEISAEESKITEALLVVLQEEVF